MEHVKQVARDRRIFYSLWAALFVFLLVVTRYVFLQGDDFLHTSITDQPYGRFDLSAWLHEWKIDYTLRNGRTADALSRLWLRPGIGVARVILSLVLMAFFYGFYRVVEVFRTSDLSFRRRLASFVAVLTMVAVIFFTDAQFYANVIAWLSGAANYLLPTALLLLGIYPSLMILAGKSPSSSQIISSTFILLLAQIAHEQHELAVLLYWGAFLFLVYRVKRRPLSRLLKLQMLVSLLVGAIHLTAPGIWIRMDVVDALAVQELPRLQRYLFNFATGSQGFVWYQRYLLLLLIPILLRLIWRGERADSGRKRRIIESVFTVGILAGNVLFAALRRRFYMHNILGGLNGLPASIVSLIALVSVVGVLALAILITYLLLRDKNTAVQSAVIWIAMSIGNTAILLLIGSLNFRSFFPGAIYLSALLLQVCFALLDEQRRRVPARRAWTVIAVSLLFTGIVFTQTAYQARANHLVWEPIEAELAAAHETQAATIEIKDTAVYPYPYAMYFRAFNLEGYGDSIRHYYAVPAGSELVQVVAE